MSGLFSSPKMPAPVTMAPPNVTSPAVQQAADAERAAQAQAAGRASTVLTSGLGAPALAPANLARKTLLGQ